MMPIFMGLLAWVAVGQDLVGLVLAERVECISDCTVFIGENGSREQRGVHSAGATNGHTADRNASRHLRYRQQGVHAIQRLGLNRDAQDRYARLGRRHARQVRRASGARDDDFQATLDVLAEARFDTAYMFVYSPREGTPAAIMAYSVVLDL